MIAASEEQRTDTDLHYRLPTCVPQLQLFERRLSDRVHRGSSGAYGRLDQPVPFALDLSSFLRRRRNNLWVSTMLQFCDTATPPRVCARARN